jgi:hypothetical protein
MQSCRAAMHVGCVLLRLLSEPWASLGAPVRTQCLFLCVLCWRVFNMSHVAAQDAKREVLLLEGTFGMFDAGCMHDQYHLVRCDGVQIWASGDAFCKMNVDVQSCGCVCTASCAAVSCWQFAASLHFLQGLHCFSCVQSRTRRTPFHCSRHSVCICAGATWCAFAVLLLQMLAALGALDMFQLDLCQSERPVQT